MQKENGIKIRVARTPKDIKAYIKFAWEIYRSSSELNKNWVPHPIDDYIKTLDITCYPLWQHAERECFTAWQDGRMVGTITATKNQRHLDIYHDNTGFWGFFECINDTKVSRALFDAAKDWLSKKHLTRMRGPISPSMNDQLGMLFKGYDNPPVFLMTYNPAYYHDLCEDYGFNIAEELVAWSFDKNKTEHQLGRFKRIAELVKKKENIHIRTINMADYDSEAMRILKVYNEAWEANWGFVPMTESEFIGLAKDLKRIIDPDFIYIALNSQDEPIGVSISIPDLNQVFIHLNGNILTPIALAKFFWYKRKINRLRTIIMGTVKDYRNKGIDAVFNTMTIETGLKKGYSQCELSWVLKSNKPMQKLATGIGAEPYKEYLIYEKTI